MSDDTTCKCFECWKDVGAGEALCSDCVITSGTYLAARIRCRTAFEKLQKEILEVLGIEKVVRKISDAFRSYL